MQSPPFMNAPDKAVSLDEYIEHLKAGFHAADLRALRAFIPQLRAKAASAGEAGQGDLVKGVNVLERTLLSGEVDACSDPLPTHLAEAGVAAAYLLKGIDIIPDVVPGIGFSDDAWIVSRVLQRNPALAGAA
jgi:hypothetical protein